MSNWAERSELSKTVVWIPNEAAKKGEDRKIFTSVSFKLFTAVIVW